MKPPQPSDETTGESLDWRHTSMQTMFLEESDHLAASHHRADGSAASEAWYNKVHKYARQTRQALISWFLSYGDAGSALPPSRPPWRKKLATNVASLTGGSIPTRAWICRERLLRTLSTPNDTIFEYRLDRIDGRFVSTSLHIFHERFAQIRKQT
jgi:hypothetical protein